MVSRRRILSRSRDELPTYYGGEDDDDVWFQKDKLCRDHIQEILSKWNQIDDEIWGKVICLERNRRVAKAYARATVLTIDGSTVGFDGYRIGLCGFDNPLRDPRIEDTKRHIGHGVKLKIDEMGNVIVKRLSRTNVFVKDVAKTEENCLSAEVTKAGGQLELERPVKLFDMKLFQQNMAREMQRAYPDRRKLECQCIVVIAFVKDTLDLLDCPCWVMVINIVALDLLKSKLPIGFSKRRSIFDTQEENPYSALSPTGIYAGVGDLRPPKLPPRDPPVAVPVPDYEDTPDSSVQCQEQGSSNTDSNLYDDPYYCGLSARVPNYFRPRQEHPVLRKTQSSSYLSCQRPRDPSGWDAAPRMYPSAVNYYNSQQRW